MATDKQKLARARNWFKYNVLGTIAFVVRRNTEFAYSEKEKEKKKKIECLREQLIMEFDVTSREMGLTVLPKCWCGKVGKYKSTGVNTDRLLCKEHRDDN